MTWSLVGVGAVGSVTAGNSPLTLNMPAGTQQGDLLVAVIVYRGTNAFTKPAAWTAPTGGSVNTGNITNESNTGSISSGRIDYMIRGASAPSGTDLQWTRTALNSSRARGYILAYRQTVKPIQFDAVAVSTLGSGSTTVTRAGPTTTRDDTLVIMGCMAARDGAISGQANATSPLTWTEDATDSADATSPTSNIAVASAVKATAGPLGNISYTNAEQGRHTIGYITFTSGHLPLTADVGDFALGGQDATITHVHAGVNASVTNGYLLAVSDDDGPNVTFADADLGSTAADRQIWCFHMGPHHDGDEVEEIPVVHLESATIAGVAATLATGSFQVHPDFPLACSWWYAEVPAGTTGDVVFTYTNDPDSAGAGLYVLEVYRVTGADASQPHDADADASITDTLSFSVDIPAGGNALGAAFGPGHNTPVTATWTGLTQEDLDSMFAGTYLFTSAQKYSAAGDTALSISSVDTQGGAALVNFKLGSVVSIAPVSAGPDPLDAVHGTYALSGQAALFDRSLRVDAVHGTFALSGQVANFSLDYVVPANHGAYSLTGQAANFLQAERFAADVGTFTLSGQNVEFVEGFAAFADVGGFTLTGQVATFKRALRLVADVGAFALSGQTITLARAFSAAHALYSFSGVAADFRRALRLSGDVGSFTVTGQLATPSVDRLLTAVHGSYSLSGQAANLSVNVPAAHGTFTLSGQAVNLTKRYTLVADGGTFATSGQAVALLRVLRVEASTGSFVHTGQQADFNLDLEDPILVATEGLLAVSGQQATFVRALRLSADSGTFVAAGQQATLLRDLVTLADHGAFAVQGQSALTLRAYRMAADAGLFVYAGQAASLFVSKTLIAVPGNFLLAGQDIGYSKLSVLEALNGAFTLTGPPVVLELISQFEFTLDPGIFTATISGISFSQIETVVPDMLTALTSRPLGDTVTEIELTKKPLGDTDQNEGIPLTSRPLG
jgi:hypothetical protein